MKIKGKISLARPAYKASNLLSHWYVNLIDTNWHNLLDINQGNPNGEVFHKLNKCGTVQESRVKKKPLYSKKTNSKHTANTYEGQATIIENEKIDTGLDPSIVFYMQGNRSRDIDQSDANFVDIIHTGAGVLGQWRPNGHADFYINGGSSQPGCTSDTLFKTIACDHTRVTPYFIESIISRKGFFAYPCPNLVSYLIGWCSPDDHEYVLMGEHVSHRGIYYVKTNPKPPLAQGDPRTPRRRKVPKPSRPDINNL